MPRVLCLLLGLMFASLSLVDATIRPNDPSPSDLILARGGDPGQGKDSKPCDQESGVYLGCTKAGDPCRQCLKRNEDGSMSPTMADTLNPLAPKTTTGYMRSQASQNCGNYFTGNCVVAAGSPTGFRCEAIDSMNTCTTGIQQIVPQVIIAPGWEGGPAGVPTGG
jgi:hypothetical protein